MCSVEKRLSPSVLDLVSGPEEEEGGVWGLEGKDEQTKEHYQPICHSIHSEGHLTYLLNTTS